MNTRTESKLVALIWALMIGMFSTGVHAVSVDLSTWTAEGGGAWELQGSNDAVLQRINTLTPTVFYDGNITVQVKRWRR